HRGEAEQAGHAVTLPIGLPAGRLHCCSPWALSVEPRLALDRVPASARLPWRADAGPLPSPVLGGHIRRRAGSCCLVGGWSVHWLLWRDRRALGRPRTTGVANQWQDRDQVVSNRELRPPLPARRRGHDPRQRTRVAPDRRGSP